MGYVTASDGAQIFYKDWGAGRPVVLSHGWPLNSDSWEAQALFLAGNGYRVIAHDRRGHGRSTQTWDGNEMDTYADDLAALVDHLDLAEATMVGFSTGGGEVARYVGRHGTGRVAQVVLVSAVPPFMLRTEDNPGGVPVEVFDAIRAGSLAADAGAVALGTATVELARALLISAAHPDRRAQAVMHQTLLTRVRAHVRQHLAGPSLRPATIAAAHNVSLRHLYKVCAQADFSLEQWIIGERLRGAREELVHPASRGRTIAMIARQWGFTDPTHFTRRFRAAYGITPSEWRRAGTEPEA